MIVSQTKAAFDFDSEVVFPVITAIKINQKPQKIIWLQKFHTNPNF